LPCLIEVQIDDFDSREVVVRRHFERFRSQKEEELLEDFGEREIREDDLEKVGLFVSDLDLLGQFVEKVRVGL
jgi:hypothetical protein